MDNHVRVRVFLVDLLDVLLPKAFVNLTVPLPENDVGVGHFFDVLPFGIPRVPHSHTVFQSQPVSGILTEVFIGEKEDLIALLESVLESLVSVRGGTDQPALLGTERLEVGVRVHVGDWNDGFVGRGGSDFGPCSIDLQSFGHPSHRTRRLHRRQEHGLGVVGDDIGRFGHECHTTEDDVRSLGFGGALRKCIGVTDEIGVFDDLLTLVVVSENQYLITQLVTGLLNAPRPLSFRQFPILWWKLFQVIVLEETEICFEVCRFEFWHGFGFPAALATSPPL